MSRIRETKPIAVHVAITDDLVEDWISIVSDDLTSLGGDVPERDPDESPAAHLAKLQDRVNGRASSLLAAGAARMLAAGWVAEEREARGG